MFLLVEIRMNRLNIQSVCAGANDLIKCRTAVPDIESGRSHFNTKAVYQRSMRIRQGYW